MENKLIPSVEKRIAAWADVSKKQQERKNKEQKTKTITISREFGCEGFPLALELKSLLDAQTKEIWTIFDELLIDKIQEDRQISKSLLKGFGEQSTFMDNLLSMLVPNWDTEEEAYRSIVETIFAIAKEGNAIIVGRGGSVITQSLSNCYHFRLIAPKDFRVQVTATRMKISFDEAEKEI
ncbi:MAG: cytidylate kinase-like family protein, partial [Deltaproteobacteria bacterium]|nr:cytidylate kinase-like family protein [Deltaproteobacteria bacterium]